MGKAIGRLGYLGIGIESTPGTPVSASVYLPYSDISLMEKHEPIEINSALTSRIMDTDSLFGKTWGEGEVEIIADIVNSGYLWKAALGSEVLTTGTPNTHMFFTTVSGNAPTTATLIQGRDTDILQYAYAAVDNLTFSFADGEARVRATFMTQAPTTGSAQTVTTTSGTMLSFKDATFKLGATIAGLGSATPINEFNLSISNNLELIYQSGSASPTAIRTKGVKVEGSFSKLFDDTVESTAYMNLTKRALELTLTGNTNEDLRIQIPEFRVVSEVTTGLDDFFMVKSNFVAEDDVESAVRYIQVRLRNSKSTAY